jgi:signal peptidase I
VSSGLCGILLFSAVFFLIRKKLSSPLKHLEPEEAITEKEHPRKVTSFPAQARRYLKYLLAGFFCWLFIRAFFFQAVYIPSASMENTLREGDYIVVNKLAYGPRLPITLFSLPFLDSYLDWIVLPYMRIPGYSEVRHNDVVVFNLPAEDERPVDMRKLYIKRCAGLPGDTFRIVEGEILINGKPLAVPAGQKLKYAMRMNPGINGDSLLREKKIAPDRKSPDGSYFTLMLASSEVDALKPFGEITEIRSAVKTFDSRLFPNNVNCKWNLDNYGPFVIPKKDLTVRLDSITFPLYKKAIAVYENNSILSRNDSVFINGKYAATYTFKQDYFFTIGDNWYNSEDSRYWGFLPESHLVGRAAFMLSSRVEGKSFSGIK